MLLRHTLNRAANSLAEALVHFWEAREKEKRTPVEGVGGRSTIYPGECVLRAQSS